MPAHGHSLFPASAAKRLLSCPASYGLSLAMDDGSRRASVFSAEGTLAHLIAETSLRANVPLEFFLGAKRVVDGFEIEVTQTFLDGVKVYTDFVQLLRGLGYKIRLEQSVDPSWVWSDLAPLPLELYGTADCMAVSEDGRRLVIVDLKFGKGVPVDPFENAQLMYYGLGALDHELSLRAHGQDGEGIEVVDLVVVQPRIPHGDGPVRQWSTTPSALGQWGLDVLYPGVIASIADMGNTPVPGDHCQFCPARLGCSAPRELAAEMSRQGFLALPLDDELADPSLPDPLDPGAAEGKNLFAAMAVSDARLQEILNAAVIVEPLIEEAKQIAKTRMLLGATFDNWEVVTRAGKRSWNAGVADIVRKLELDGYNPLPLIQMRTPAQIEEDHPEVYRYLAPFLKEAEPTAVLQQTKNSKKRSPRRDQAALPGPSSDIPPTIGDVHKNG